MEGKFLFLGTGGSLGVPVIGCNCTVCQSNSPYDKRFRTSGLITFGDKNFLIDSGPDFRNQALSNKLNHIDALLLTHLHYDHIAGIDDLRIFNSYTEKAIPCYLSYETFYSFQHQYYYLFTPPQGEKSAFVQIDCHPLAEESGNFKIFDCPFSFFNYYQGLTQVTGFRFGDCAYLTDIRSYSDHIFDWLKGTRTLIIGASKLVPSKMHFSFDEAMAFSQKVSPSQTYITHISDSILHASAAAHLPNGIKFAYDGLEITFNI
ncbi:MAG: lipB [Chlamydiales bacterium]|jgi:phosphoribosyl 1,2-cyclic phosphate phosphodiesterase|nr:lipB [Chlamydiales bacterium]